jgi:hypothetical protein
MLQTISIYFFMVICRSAFNCENIQKMLLNHGDFNRRPFILISQHYHHWLMSNAAVVISWKIWNSLNVKICNFISKTSIITSWNFSHFFPGLNWKSIHLSGSGRHISLIHCIGFFVVKHSIRKSRAATLLQLQDPSW